MWGLPDDYHSFCTSRHEFPLNDCSTTSQAGAAAQSHIENSNAAQIWAYLQLFHAIERTLGQQGSNLHTIGFVQKHCKKTLWQVWYWGANWIWLGCQARVHDQRACLVDICKGFLNAQWSGSENEEVIFWTLCPTSSHIDGSGVATARIWSIIPTNKNSAQIFEHNLQIRSQTDTQGVLCKVCNHVKEVQTP